ncbi:unnamed protein product, partial [Phaeothamnion confervicola]
IYNSTFQRGVATGSGGAAWIANSSLTVSGTAFSANVAGGFGGAVEFTGAGASLLYISDSSFEGNNGALDGGAVFASGCNASVSGSNFRNNTSGGGSGGGASFLACTALEVSETTFTDNGAYNNGGGVHVWIEDGDGSDTVTMSNVTFESNAAMIGGGVSLV